MAGIYIHIPFCKQACHYCDFHFSTSLKHKDSLIESLCKELFLRKDELSLLIETIYFGGGTPSLLSVEDIQRIMTAVNEHYTVNEHPEITLEANPDDLSDKKIIELSKSLINRLSIGVQSFFEEDLKLMNRAHNEQEALQCIALAKQHFDNISIDLIYGIPGMTSNRWIQNLNTAINLNVPHISSYALTVEPDTALKRFIDKGLISPVNDELAKTHFDILVETLQSAGYSNYEFSNFGKPGYMSRNNTAYWTGKPYLGIGPSAHSYVNNTRSWNINNNIKYIKSIQNLELPNEVEVLSKVDQYNEYVMTGLRTIWGVSLSDIEVRFGQSFKSYLIEQAQPFIKDHLLYIDEDNLYVSQKGKFLSDGIASALFMLNLK